MFLALLPQAHGRAEAEEATHTFERSITVGAAPRLALTAYSGTVEIRGEDSPTLGVKVTRRATASTRSAAEKLLARSAVKVTGEVGSASVQFWWDGLSEFEEIKARAREGKLAGVWVQYLVSVPRGAQVELAIIDGEVVGSSLEAGLTVQTAGASVLLNRVAGGCNLATLTGDVTVAGVEGGLAIQTVGGSVKGSVVRGSAVIDSVSGPVELALEPRGKPVIRIRSVSAPVAISLPVGAGGMIDAESGTGTIQDLLGSRMEKTGRRLWGSLGRPGADVLIRSVSGGIKLGRIPAR